MLAATVQFLESSQINHMKQIISTFTDINEIIASFKKMLV